MIVQQKNDLKTLQTSID